MKNYWLSRKRLKITAATCSFEAMNPNKWGGIDFKHINVTTNWGNTYRCCVSKEGMLQSLIVKRTDDQVDLLFEEEWEIVGRYVEKIFLATGQLKERIHGEKKQSKV